MNSLLHLKIRVTSAGHRTVSGWSLTTPYGARPGIGRCYHIRRRPAPVRYVTTQEKILKNRPVPGRLSNSPVICKSVKSYDVSFICDHSINKFHERWCPISFKCCNLHFDKVIQFSANWLKLCAFQISWLKRSMNDANLKLMSLHLNFKTMRNINISWQLRIKITMTCI